VPPVDDAAPVTQPRDLDLAVRYADRAWLMDGGRLVAAGRWDEVLTPDRLGPVYGLGLEWIDSGKERPHIAVGSVGGDTIDKR